MIKANNNINTVFNHDPYTVGIEEEYMICNPLSGDLVHKSNMIMDSLKEEFKDRYSYELIQSEIESNTSFGMLLTSENLPL